MNLRLDSDGLLLDERDLVLSNYGAIDAIGQFEARIDPQFRMLRLDVLLDEKLEHELRYLDAVEGHRIDVNVALPTAPVGMRVYIDVVYAAEDAEQRIGRMDSGANLIKIDFCGAADRAL